MLIPKMLKNGQHISPYYSSFFKCFPGQEDSGVVKNRCKSIAPESHRTSKICFLLLPLLLPSPSPSPSSFLCVHRVMLVICLKVVTLPPPFPSHTLFLPLPPFLLPPPTPPFPPHPSPPTLPFPSFPFPVTLNIPPTLRYR